ncbi:MAG: hypothetical protein ACTHLU_08330 [Novosphingobium sp.]
MRSKLFLASTACGLAFFAMPATALAPAVEMSSGYTIGIRGFVPVICRASLDATTAATQPGVQRLGSLREFCNSPNGYRVQANYSANLAQAKLLIDGKSVPLQKDGTVVVSQSNRAGIVSRTVELDLGKAVSGGSISFQIQPL